MLREGPSNSQNLNFMKLGVSGLALVLPTLLSEAPWRRVDNEAQPPQMRSERVPGSLHGSRTRLNVVPFGPQVDHKFIDNVFLSLK